MLWQGRRRGPAPHERPTTTPASSPTSRRRRERLAEPDPSPSPGRLPDVTAWRPAPELVPACKLAAVRRVEGAGNGPDTALQVIDAQYGGLLTDTASVLVVTRSWRRAAAGSSPAATRTTSG